MTTCRGSRCRIITSGNYQPAEHAASIVSTRLSQCLVACRGTAMISIIRPVAQRPARTVATAAPILRLRPSRRHECRLRRPAAEGASSNAEPRRKRRSIQTYYLGAGICSSICLRRRTCARLPRGDRVGVAMPSSSPGRSSRRGVEMPKEVDGTKPAQHGDVIVRAGRPRRKSVR